MGKKKQIDFKDSLLGQLGWTEKQYIKMQMTLINLKFINNFRLTPTETQIWIDNVDDYMKGKL